MENKSEYISWNASNAERNDEIKKEDEINNSPSFLNIPTFEFEGSMENLSFSLNASRRGSYFSYSNADAPSLIGSTERSLLVPHYLARRGSSTIPDTNYDPNIAFLRPNSTLYPRKTRRSPSYVSAHSNILERILTPIHSFRSRECLLASLASGTNSNVISCSQY